MHDSCRYQVVDSSRDEEIEKCPEFHDAFLPHHQRGDVTKGREGTTGIGAYYNVNAGKADKTAVITADCHYHGTHQQRGGQVVGNRRDKKCQYAGNPEQGAKAKTAANQPGAQGIKDPSFLHGVDVGHRYQQEQHQLSIFLQVVPESLFSFMTHAVTGIDPADNALDNAGGEDNRFGLTKMSEFLCHHEHIGYKEQD